MMGCVGDIGEPSVAGGNTGSGDTPGEEPTGAATVAVHSGARRLTRTEYDNTLRDLLQDGTQPGFAKLPEDVNDPFDNDYTTQTTSAALIEAAETLAAEASARALSDPAIRDSIVPCTPTGPDDAACLRSFIASFGRKALRRPLAEEEVDRFAALGAYAIEKGDFYIGVSLALQALLQDPEFLYRIELGTPIPGAPGVFKLGAYEVATRLSYFLLGTTPPDDLLLLADQDKLGTPSQVREAATMLLSEEAAKVRVDRFHALWLGYHQLPHSGELTAAMRAETEALVTRVIFEEQASYLALFSTEETFLTPTLATHYGAPQPPDPNGAWMPYEDTGRQGILSHGSVLSAFGKFADTSPTQRGIFIRTRLLCQELASPPENVVADVPPMGAGPGLCKEDRYAEHASNGSCKGCHEQTDPVGFGLENYDNAGRFRTHDEGAPECVISGEGNLVGYGTFNGPAELSDLLVDSGTMQECVVTQVYRFAMGRREASEDKTLIEGLAASFKNSDYSFQELLVELTGAEAFGLRREEEVEE